MSGHSKWAKLKHTKGKKDQQKGQAFTKLIRIITVSAREGGPDPSCNSKLRLAIDKALAENMTKDTIERAIKRASGDGENAVQMEEVIYEGYGPHGTAILVKCLTDNRNRTVSEVRHAFTRAGGNLGSSGSVAYLFSEKGYFIFAPGTDENKVMEIAINEGADDVIVDEDKSIEVITTPAQFSAVKDALTKAGLESAQASVMHLPSVKVTLDAEQGEKVQRLLDSLEELDDVQEVYSNAEF